ncbi:MAG: STAS/SEC14 domain-containing protein [Chloroflexi bacterium]|nr:STAS/SEC14 domain-containing protein [Chloroflexota bacterium]
MESKVIHTSKARVWQEEDSIVRLEILPNAHITLKDAKEMVLAVQSYDGQPPVLADIRLVRAVDREARLQSSYPEFQDFRQASALLVGSPVSRIIGNFFIGLNRPSIPIALFASEEEALAWLKEFLP